MCKARFALDRRQGVQQEVNGLLTEDRQPKVALDTLKRIFEGK